MFAPSLRVLRFALAGLCVLALGAALGAPAQATIVLSSGYVTPTSGDTNTTFTYRVKYWNTDGVLPDAVKTCIWSSGTGPRWFTMWPLEPGDTNPVDGKWYTLSLKLAAGSYAYRFAAQNGATWTYLPLPAGAYSSGPSVTLPAPVTSLTSGYVTPTSGTTATTFTYRIKYWDTGNRAPDLSGGKPQVLVAIWWGSQSKAFWYPMWKLDATDTNYRDGCWYTFSLKWLDASVHQFRFAVQTGGAWTYWPQPTGTYVDGPEVDNKPLAPWPLLGFPPDSDSPDDISVIGVASPGATAYHLYQSLDGVTWSLLPQSPLLVLGGWWFKVYGVADGTRFRVTASNAYGEGEPSEPVVAWPSRIASGLGDITGTSPHGGQTGVSRSPLLQWGIVPSAEFYMVSVMALEGGVVQGDVYDVLMSGSASSVTYGQASGPGIIWSLRAAGDIGTNLEPNHQYRLLVRAFYSDHFEFASSSDQDFWTGP